MSVIPKYFAGIGRRKARFHTFSKDSQVFWLSKRVNRVISSIATKVRKLSIYLLAYHHKIFV